MISRKTIADWAGITAQDARFGFRTLARAPFTALVMIVSIALGIGVATAVFTLADVMLMRPLPFPMADRLVVPFQTLRVKTHARADTIPWTFARYELLNDAARGLDVMGFATWTDAILRTPGSEEQSTRVEAVTRSLLTTFVITPQAGRVFTPEEDGGTYPTTVGLISDRLWRTKYSGSPAVIGTTILLDGAPVKVIGVMPARFSGFVVGADVWLPVRMMPRIDPSSRWTERLAFEPGVVIGRRTLSVSMTTLERYLTAALPLVNDIATSRLVADKGDLGIGVMTLAEARRHPLVKPMLALMSAAVVALLAIVCANVASILLSRGHARRGEMGVRIALGASPVRLGRQVLTECALLGVVALPVGILLGWLGASILAGLRPALPPTFVLLRGTDLLSGASLAPNLDILLFGSAVASLATICFGIGPAAAAARVDARTLIATSGDLHATTPMRGRQILVASQVALATILLVSASLALRSLNSLLRTDLGFHPDSVVAIQVVSTDTTLSARIRRRDFVRQLSSARGILSVAVGRCTPFDLACVSTRSLRGLGSSGNERPLALDVHEVTAGYFRTLDIPLVRGRDFLDQDTTADHPAVVLSMSAARQLFGVVQAIGRQVIFDSIGTKPMDVVGIVGDVRFRLVDRPATPAVYVLSTGETGGPHFVSTIFVTSATSAAGLGAGVAADLRSSNAPMSVASAQSVSDIVREQTSTTRFVAVLLSAFAVAALALANLGVYGVVSSSVSHRTKELGIRLVLGADDYSLLGSVLQGGALMVAVGAVIGLGAAFVVSKLLAAFLFGIEPFDASTYTGVALVMILIGAAATLIPARRVLRLDPSAALRT